MSRNVIVEQAITRACHDAGRPIPVWLVVRMASAIDQALGAPPPRVPGTPGMPQDIYLTARQRQLAALFADGLTNNEIAKRLFLTEDTVKTHSRRTFVAMGARTRAHAAALATRWGLANPVHTPRKATAA